MVHFVGAGPGDPELITVKGRDLLAKANLIIYAGSLVNPELLKYAGTDAVIKNSAYMTLDEVISDIRTFEDKGLSTVRLHTGDPSIYGAIREQIDELEKYGISYDITPGVSSFSAAAATLGAEYTLPSVSQSLILTRMAGRTDVPDSESIASFASHHSSMAIFLSAGKLDKLSEQLIAGGYDPDTSAAIVYKASWPEEKTIRCKISELYDKADKANITKTALILVGDFLGDRYDKSRLYDPGFSTEYRKAKIPENETPFVGWNINCICFTDRGEKTAKVLSGSLDINIDRSKDDTRVMEWTAHKFKDSDALVYIGACGIAVRAIASHIKKKDTDPAVICIDEAGQFVIPILSGHIGGANMLASTIADRIGAQVVLTTATDVRNVFAVDTWAKSQELVIAEPERIVNVTSKILDESGSGIVIKSSLDIEGDMPEGVTIIKNDECTADVLIDIYDSRSDEEGVSADENTLHLIPQTVALGVGCKKGTSAQVIDAAFRKFCKETRINREAFYMIASIDIKAGEEGLIEFAKGLKLKYCTFDPDILRAISGSYTLSTFVEEVTGVDNVCERSAVAASQNGILIVRKTVIDGVTFAAAQKRIKLKW